MVANESDPFDRALTAILRTPKRNHREQLGRSLGNDICGPSKDGAARVETLERQVYDMKAKIRYLEKSKPI